MSNTPLFIGSDWDYRDVMRVYEAVERIATEELRLDVYPNQIEVISSEQMLDAYASMGLPLFYRHWSFGKHFARDEMLYRKGYTGLAYEIVINSKPCISYLMEENTLTMQTLVIAHAAFGHNHFFKNNRLFQEWTDAEGILDYLDFAKSFISECEERYGVRAVEQVIDAAHALMGQGVDRYPKPHSRNLREERDREIERIRYEEQTYNDLWRTVPGAPDDPLRDYADPVAARRERLGLPEENLLYFLEKRAPLLEHWQREILRIVRNTAQYFYPQRQTKVMNEGCASAVHYYIMTRLHEDGLLTDGAFLEFLHSHTSVVMQPDFDDLRFSGINPYALGFAILQDLKRIATQPTAEDRQWFPQLAGCGDWVGVWQHAWREFRDESFILQFLSPKVIRDFQLFSLYNEASAPELVVAAIHDATGYRQIRSALAKRHDLAYIEPDIQVVDVDLAGDRKLILEHRINDGATLEKRDAQAVLGHLANLWGYAVKLYEVDAESGRVINEFPEVAPGNL
ncbi:SpoVR family protein [Halorhodospira halochloris]|uniref:SpoVR family protein n=1 Tax=Halorhodospira halochloris TaxID=1052 RepID=UPI001EE98B8C|nr:SpoVR family protein [Halorhodospira halochloris]MCG5530399.1 SpoVR family protein [Halorhodospira halochloris]MCG5548641.1 SpoVR family protein [Halorhodospira halochloris]